jgi:hypothetical protein
MISTIDLHTAGSFLRLIVHSPLLNDANLCGQVGIAALTVDGEVHLEESSRVLRAAPAPDFHLLLHGIDLEGDFLHAEARDAGVDPEAEQALRTARRLQADAVAREDYDEAQRLGDVIAAMTAAGRRLVAADTEKQRAVDREVRSTSTRQRPRSGVPPVLTSCLPATALSLRTPSLPAPPRPPV